MDGARSLMGNGGQGDFMSTRPSPGRFPVRPGLFIAAVGALGSALDPGWRFIHCAAICESNWI
jgi:hypothetical protein